uniref:Uncharacterized protein n=1 Tax=Octopus bimaculoides TaxID=37653 RepID=A0A0L8IBP6_OCTBM
MSAFNESYGSTGVEAKCMFLTRLILGKTLLSKRIKSSQYKCWNKSNIKDRFAANYRNDVGLKIIENLSCLLSHFLRLDPVQKGILS